MSQYPLTKVSVKPKSTWILLKPHFDKLVSNFVFPHLTFNETRRALWDSDPIDYVRVSAGIFSHLLGVRIVD